MKAIPLILFVCVASFASGVLGEVESISSVEDFEEKLVLLMDLSTLFQFR